MNLLTIFPRLDLIVSRCPRFESSNPIRNPRAKNEIEIVDFSRFLRHTDWKMETMTNALREFSYSSNHIRQSHYVHRPVLFRNRSQFCLTAFQVVMNWSNKQWRRRLSMKGRSGIYKIKDEDPSDSEPRGEAEEPSSRTKINQKRREESKMRKEQRNLFSKWVCSLLSIRHQSSVFAIHWYSLCLWNMR